MTWICPNGCDMQETFRVQVTVTISDRLTQYFRPDDEFLSDETGHKVHPEELPNVTGPMCSICGGPVFWADDYLRRTPRDDMRPLRKNGTVDHEGAEVKCHGECDHVFTQNVYWLSFASERFLGACFVRAFDSISAVRRSYELGINPGGEVAVFDLDRSMMAKIPDKWIERLLSRAEIEEMEAELKKLGIDDKPN